MEEVLQRYLGDELTERKKIHEEEMKELSKSVIYYSSEYTSYRIKIIWVFFIETVKPDIYRMYKTYPENCLS